MAVYRDGVKVATVDTYASSTKPRQFLYKRGSAAPSCAKYIVKNVSTSSWRNQVAIDGTAGLGNSV